MNCGAEADAIKELFRRCDINGDGLISKTELTGLLQRLSEDISSDDINEIIGLFDKNCDGMLQYSEFIDWVMNDGSKLAFAADLDMQQSTSCNIGGSGTFTLTVNKITKGGSQQVTMEVSPQESVADVIKKLEPELEADLRHHNEFDNLPKELSLLDVGISQPMEVDLQISCMKLKMDIVAQPAETAGSCGIGGAGSFILSVNKITRGGTEQVTIEVSPQDLVANVISRLEPNFQADLRHHAEFENLPQDLTLLDVGICQPMEVDLQISCMMKEA